MMGTGSCRRSRVRRGKSCVVMTACGEGRSIVLVCFLMFIRRWGLLIVDYNEGQLHLQIDSILLCKCRWLSFHTALVESTRTRGGLFGTRRSSIFRYPEVQGSITVCYM